MTKRFQDLTPLYYYDHFREMIDFVVNLYGDILGPDETRFLIEFEELSQDARCLFIRICNRKRTTYSNNNLSYAEIGDIQKALAELANRGWLRKVEREDFENILKDFTKDKLVSVMQISSGEPFKKSWKKSQLLSHAMKTFSYDWFEQYIAEQNLFIPDRRPVTVLVVSLFRQNPR